MILEKKIEYIKSLTLDEVRYELDKIHARLKNVESLQGMRDELGDEYSFDSGLDVLDKDYERLLEEKELYSYYFNELWLKKE